MGRLIRFVVAGLPAKPKPREGWSRAKSQPKVDRLDHKGWPMVADQLILQTVFLGVLAAVIVNIRSRPRKKPREKVARAASF